ncbi:hypothetical protein [Nocardiopsis sp. NPDC057823]|uniref:hypothetical protein n=1 Tax=Nocardiopsis sp. NPDC057823 TaxID=3346256 RepID=UPI003671A0C1
MTIAAFLTARLAEALAQDVHTLPEATHTDIDRRTRDELHDCVRCGSRAQVAFLLGPSPEAGLPAPRWVDLCSQCSTAVREWAHQERGRQEGDQP